MINDDNKEIINEDYFECPVKYWNKVGSLYISPEININNKKLKVKFFINNVKSSLSFDIESSSLNINKFGYVYVNYAVSFHKIKDHTHYYAKEFTTFQQKDKNFKDFTFENPSDFEDIKYLIEKGVIIIGVYICIYRNNFKGPSLSKEGKLKLSRKSMMFSQIKLNIKKHNSESETIDSNDSVTYYDAPPLQSSVYISKECLPINETSKTIQYDDYSPDQHSESVIMLNQIQPSIEKQNSESETIDSTSSFDSPTSRRDVCISINSLPITKMVKTIQYDDCSPDQYSESMMLNQIQPNIEKQSSKSEVINTISSYDVPPPRRRVYISKESLPITETVKTIQCEDYSPEQYSESVISDDITTVEEVDPYFDFNVSSVQPDISISDEDRSVSKTIDEIVYSNIPPIQSDVSMSDERLSTDSISYNNVSPLHQSIFVSDEKLPTIKSVNPISYANISPLHRSIYVADEKLPTTKTANIIPNIDASPLQQNQYVLMEPNSGTVKALTNYDIIPPKRSVSLCKMTTSDFSKNKNRERSFSLTTPLRTSSISKHNTSELKKEISSLPLNTPSSENNSMNSFSDSSTSNSSKKYEGVTFISLFDCEGKMPNELSFVKGELLTIYNWNGTNEWAIGYSQNNPQKHGLIPKSIVTKYNSVHITSFTSPLKNTDSYFNGKYDQSLVQNSKCHEVCN
jgi:hypothetical protein